MKSWPVDNWSTSKQSSSKQKCRGESMVAFFFMKSALMKPVTLETGTMMNASWYVNAYLPQVFSAMSER